MLFLMPVMFFGVVFVVGWGVLALSERQLGVARIVVRQMAMVTSQNLPLGTGLTLAGRSEPGKAGVILRRVADFVSIGLPLGDAVARGYPSRSGLIASIIQAGEHAGRLPAALRMLQSDLDEQALRRTRMVPLGIAYGVLLLFLLLLIWSFIMVVVIPKFKEIFSDFSTELPALTKVMISASFSNVGQPLALVLLAVLVLATPLGVYWSFRPRRHDRPRISSLIADQFRWITPGLHRLELADGLSTFASLLRLFVGAGMGLERAAVLAAETDLNAVLRDRVREFAHGLEGGVPPPEAAERAGLGPVFTTALRSGQRGDRMDATLQFVADYYRAMISRFWIVVRNIAWPVVTLIMAVLVGTFVVAMFTPLVSLIDSVMVNM